MHARFFVIGALLVGVVLGAGEESSASTSPTSATPPSMSLEERRSCESCHLVMDTLYGQLMSQFMKQRRTTRGAVELKGDQMALAVCDEITKTPQLYGPTAMKMCRSFLEAHRSAVVSTFSRNFEINDNVDSFFQLKGALCDGIVPGCMRPQSKPKIDECDACKLLMEDAERVFSWGIGRDNFATNEHLYRVVEDLCSNLLVRHPIRFHHTLLEVCNDMTDDHSGAIVKAFQTSLKTKGPAPARKICIDITRLCPKEKSEL